MAIGGSYSTICSGFFLLSRSHLMNKPVSNAFWIISTENVFETIASVDSSQYFHQHQSKIFRLTNRMGYSKYVDETLQSPGHHYHHVSSVPNKRQCSCKLDNGQFVIFYTAKNNLILFFFDMIRRQLNRISITRSTNFIIESTSVEPAKRKSFATISATVDFCERRTGTFRNRAAW